MGPFFSNQLVNPTGAIRDTVRVEHCLVGEEVDMRSVCEVNYNADILILLCVLTAADTFIIFYIAMAHKEPTIVQLGDAIADALERNTTPPDISNVSLSTNNETHNAQDWPGNGVGRLFWFSAVSRKTWIVSLFL